MKAIFPKANNDIVNGFVRNFNQYSGQFGIADDETTAQFLAQSGTETREFTRVSENMKYKKLSILQDNFGRLFKNGNYNAKDYLNNGDALAKLAYGVNKSGLDYRGRGTMQLTREGNYQNFTGFYDKQFNSSLNFVAHPDLLSLNYKYATISGLWFFKTHVIDQGANMADTDTITELITGPSKNGLHQRMYYFNKASLILSLFRFLGIR